MLRVVAVIVIALGLLAPHGVCTCGSATAACPPCPLGSEARCESDQDTCACHHPAPDGEAETHDAEATDTTPVPAVPHVPARPHDSSCPAVAARADLAKDTASAFHLDL